MKITIPTSIEDITLKQYILCEDIKNSDLDIEQKKVQIVQVMLNIDMEDVLNMKARVFDEIYSLVFDAFSNSTGKSKGFLKQHGLKMVEMDLITQAEFSDMSRYITDINKLNRFMAVCLRPVDKKGNIIRYEGTQKTHELMHSCPMDLVEKATGFFLTYRQGFKKHTRRFTKIHHLARVRFLYLILKSGAGLPALKKSLRRIFWRRKS